MDAKPYGSWDSKITAELILSSSQRVGAPKLLDGEVIWSESVAEEQNRTTIASATGSIIPAPYDVASKVHEYGGGAWWCAGESIYFSNRVDSGLYKASGGVVREVVPPDSKYRYADGTAARSGVQVCIREDHSGLQVRNDLVSISSDGDVTVIVSGPDFVSSPRLSPDGSKLCWVEWDHPAMPWTAARLKVASFSSELTDVHQITDGASAVQMPGWLNDGSLVYVDDPKGFWNLHRFDLETRNSEALTSFSSAETGRALWQLGTTTWCQSDDGSIVFVVTAEAIDSLARLDLTTRKVTLFETGFVKIDAVASAGSGVVILGSNQTSTAQIVTLELSAAAGAVVKAPSLSLEPNETSFGEAFKFVCDEVEVQGFFYPPLSAAFQGPKGELPPLIVMGHGGPTGHNSNAFNLKVQFWTSRGFAVADINYRGSTGFGRRYRELLDGYWGERDVADHIRAAEYLISQNKVNSQAVAIRGGSSSGLTVMAALIESEVFSCGVSLYGVANLVDLAKETHKFESRYLDLLVGKFPEEIDTYLKRSPSEAISEIQSPLLLMHGSEDAVVPLAQSEEIYAGLRSQGVPCELKIYEGEAHGFRSPQVVADSLETELWFYSQVFGFDVSLDINTMEMSLK